MNSKQECIAKAYEKHGYNWEEIKEVVSQEGWCNCRLVSKLSLSGKQEDSACGYYVRPIELQGIENNNGWLTINGKLDFPAERGQYFVVVKGIVQIAGYAPEYQKWMTSGHYYFAEYKDLGITHYQPISKPNPPLY